MIDRDFKILNISIFFCNLELNYFKNNSITWEKKNDSLQGKCIPSKTDYRQNHNSLTDLWISLLEPHFPMTLK